MVIFGVMFIVGVITIWPSLQGLRMKGVETVEALILGYNRRNLDYWES